MSLFLNEVQSGIEGRNQGLSGGLPRLDKSTNNIQKKMIYIVGADTKTGKTAFINHRFIISPYLNHPDLISQKKINWIYFSYEIDRLETIAKFVAYFMLKDYNIRCDINYILGRGDNRMDSSHHKMVKRIYEQHIIPLFGVQDKFGKLISPGHIDFIEERNNPTGIRNYLYDYAAKHGELIYDEYRNAKGERKKKLVGYNQYDPDLYTIILLDHVGLCRRERGFNKKENLDKLSDYFVEIRNLFRFTIVGVSQFNRSLGKIDRLKFSGEQLQPTKEDFKDTGNLAEDASMVIALFNAGNYPHLDSHMGYKLSSFKIKQHYRSCHVLASRNSEAPVSVPLFFDGRMGEFRELARLNNPTELTRQYDWINKLS